MNLLALLYLCIASLTGMSFITLLPFRLGRVLMLAGPALGIILTTELILLLSLFLGYSSAAIIIALLCSTVISCGVIVYKKSCLNVVKHINVGQGISNHWPLLFVLLTIGMAVFYILWTKVLAPSPDGMVTGGEGLYGDTSMHSAFTMSIVEQGLLPTNPLFARIPLIYPFLVNLFSASLVTLGMSLRFAFILPQMIYFVGFVTLFYSLIRNISYLSGQGNLSNKLTNRAAFFAMLIFFLGWGLGFTNYLKDVQSSSSWEVTKEYTNNIPGFALHNVLTGIILPARSFLPGLVIGMLITLLMLNGISKTKPNRELQTTNNELIFVGFLLGILPLWHTHTFIFFGLAIGVWQLGLVFNRLPELRSMPQKELYYSIRKILVQTTVIYIIALVFVIPVLLWSKTQVSHTTFIHFMRGWSESSHEFFTFWLRNTGLLIPLSMLGIYWMKRQYKLFFLPALFLFIVANLISFQPWDWDNIKIFSWVLLFASLPAGFALARLSERKLLRPLIVLVFFSLIASGTLSLINLSRGTFTIYDREDIELAEWVKTETAKNALFILDPWPNHAVMGLAGRSAYMGYPGHLWVHGIDYTKREALVNKVMSGDLDALTHTEVPIDYLVVPNSKLLKFPPEQQVFVNVKHTVYKIQ